MSLHQTRRGRSSVILSRPDMKQSDSLINMAYPYFLRHGDAQRKALALYYKAVICKEQNKTEENPLADESINQLAKQFVSKPAMKYRPYVWWHWMGSNFSKEVITWNAPNAGQ